MTHSPLWHRPSIPGGGTGWYLPPPHWDSPGGSSPREIGAHEETGTPGHRDDQRCSSSSLRFLRVWGISDTQSRCRRGPKLSMVMIIFDTLPFFGSMAPNVPVGGILGSIHHNGLFGCRIIANHSPFYQRSLVVGLVKVILYSLNSLLVI